MSNYTEIPNGYKEIFKVDLQKNKKLALILNLAAALLAIPMAIIGMMIVPISALFSFEDGTIVYFIRIAALIVGMIAYIILHELVHGIFMKHFCKAKVNYGFTWLYAYAGSEGYFNKKSYIVIALAPVVIWGIVLLILNCIVSASWFWCVYFIQIINITGAAGDIYVTYKFSKMPKDILVHDTGVGMTVYSREG